MSQVRAKKRSAGAKKAASAPVNAPRAWYLAYARGEARREKGEVRRFWSTLARYVAVFAGLVAFTFWIAGPRSQDSSAVATASPAPFSSAARILGLNLSHIDAYGLQRTTPEELAAAIMMESGESLLSFRPKAAKARIEALPWIREADVRRLFPDRILVSVTEKEPLAIWRIDGRSVLVDEAGERIAQINPADFPGLVIVEGLNATNEAAALVAALQARPRMAERFAAFRWVENRRWDGIARDGLTVQFAAGGLVEGLQRLERLQAEDRIFETPLSVIDLRNKNTVLRPRTGALRERGA